MTDRPLDARPIDADVAPDVEIAEKGPDFERRVGEPADVRRAPAPELADQDLLLGELDKAGNGSKTFVAKGDPIPAGLASLPRSPARPASRKR
ncbi:MAG TPA: hypothetical protein VGR74_13925 [Actinomycetota bacterium]|nr:hypothetical protein [Actinomycetota bacterium]